MLIQGGKDRIREMAQRLGLENPVLSVHWLEFGIWGEAKCGDKTCGVPHPKMKPQLRDGDSRGHCPLSAPCPDMNINFSNERGTMSGSPFQVNNEHFISSLSLNMKKIFFF